MLILHNARIYTLDPQRPVATALAIEQDRIVAVGEAAEIMDWAHAGSSVQDMEGKVILPGLVDAHIHLQHFALNLQRVDCETPTRAECLRRVAERVAQTPPGQWILGHGWNQNVWPEGFGSAQDLDVLTSMHPVFLTAKSLHAAWVNSTALRLAGIDEHTPDPPDGRIQRDERGQPTGILFEAAVELVQRCIPQPGVQEVAQAIQEAQSALWRMGLTGVHDFDQRTCFLALQILQREGRLMLRVLKSLPADLLDEAINLGLGSGFGDAWLRIGGVKLFSDGALGPQTAAMFEPYLERDDRGLLFLDAEQIFEMGRKAGEVGLSLAVHAIGDRANAEVLTGLERLRVWETASGKPHLRHRIEHVQLLRPQDVGRLARAGIIASVQPIHATSDMYMADRYWGERARFAYAYRSLLAQGTRLAFGSDAPVETPNPFWGIHAAVTRRRQDGQPGPEGWFPQERLTLEHALEAYTLGPAYAAGLEHNLGRLREGYYADLIVLDEDPWQLPADLLYQLQPCATMVGGKWVWVKGGTE
ncbi:amidohydrolase [uncultured Thermanaerothrix sp.]|uniref:amidohydrolase n=1 Tax=uncultured Thermanaerothrix sp. TaxID=1195149 RepID=UPI00263515F3|nr:amidohydrolase [uncultured Thermanaerothrix sp.]